MQNITYEAIGAGGQVAFIMYVATACRNETLRPDSSATVNA